MSRRGWLLFSLIGFIWGVPYLFMKVAVDELSIPLIVFSRLVIGAAFLIPLAIRAKSKATVRPYLKYILFYAFLELSSLGH